MKIRPVGAELLVDGRTDMMKVIVAFRDFASALKNWRRCTKSSKKTYKAFAKECNAFPLHFHIIRKARCL